MISKKVNTALNQAIAFGTTRPEGRATSEKSRRFTFWLRVLVILVVLALSIIIFMNRERAAELSHYGYPGIFLLAILSDGTIFLPAPGVLFVFAMGAVFNPFLVAIVAGLGSAIGELAGYLAGFSGQKVIENIQLYIKIKNWMIDHPNSRNMAIFFLAFIPNPLFDLAGMVAGALKIPVSRFYIFCALGKTLKMLLFALAGAGSFHFLLSL